MTDEAPSGRLVRELAAESWTLDGDGWTITVRQYGNSEFSATLYHHTQYGSHVEFAEARGASSKEEALANLRESAEARKAKIENALSFEWKA